jgi:hypothetical protein
VTAPADLAPTRTPEAIPPWPCPPPMLSARRTVLRGDQTTCAPPRVIPSGGPWENLTPPADKFSYRERPAVSRSERWGRGRTRLWSPPTSCGCRVDDQTTAAPPWRLPELVRIQAPEPDLNKDPLCSYREAMKRAGEATAVEIVGASQPRDGARVRMPRFDPAEQRCQVRHLVLFPARSLLFGDGRPASAGSA